MPPPPPPPPAGISGGPISKQRSKQLGVVKKPLAPELSRSRVGVRVGVGGRVVGGGGVVVVVVVVVGGGGGGVAVAVAVGFKLDFKMITTSLY